MICVVLHKPIGMLWGRCNIHQHLLASCPEVLNVGCNVVGKVATQTGFKLQVTLTMKVLMSQVEMMILVHKSKVHFGSHRGLSIPNEQWIQTSDSNLCVSPASNISHKSHTTMSLPCYLLGTEVRNLYLSDLMINV
jgi:hypothetical protein